MMHILFVIKRIPRFSERIHSNISNFLKVTFLIKNIEVFIEK